MKAAKKKADRIQSAGKVFIFPAFAPEHEEKQVFYLFSLRQVVEVLRAVKILPVPFSPCGTEGVAEWRGRVVPVLSLEKYLGINWSGEPKRVRSIALRSVGKSKKERIEDLYAIVNVGVKVEQLELPLECDAAETPEWITETSCLIGTYQMPNRLLLVVDIEKILFAQRGVAEW